MEILIWKDKAWRRYIDVRLVRSLSPGKRPDRGAPRSSGEIRALHARRRERGRRSGS